MSTTVHSGYINRPYQIFQAADGKAPGRVEGLVRGVIYNYSNTGRQCWMSYNAFAEKFHVSRSTIARAISGIKGSSDVKIERRGGQANHYTYDGKIEKKAPHIFTPDFLQWELFCFPGNERRMRGIERDVYSLILTHSLNKNGKGQYEGTDKQIAKKLGCSERSVYAAILNLLKAELIYRPRKGVNRHINSTYTANMGLFLCVAKKNKLKRKDIWTNGSSSTEEKKLAKSDVDANARAERERYYALLREKAQARVDKYTLQARKNPRFEAVSIEIARLQKPLALAELREPDKLPALIALEEDLREERKEILKEMGLSELHITVQHKCALCEDTGFRKTDGKQCTCYVPKGGQ